MKRCISYSITFPNVFDTASGGNTTYLSILDAIEKCGYSLSIVTPKTRWIPPEKGDILLYKDIFNDPNGQNGWFNDEQYSELLNTNAPFLLSECAYTACTTSPYAIAQDYDNDLSSFSNGFFIKAHKTILVSNFQLQNILKYNVTVTHPYIYTPYIDTSIFYNKHLKQKYYKYIYIGAINKEKGVFNVIDKYQNDGLIIVGRNSKNLINSYPKVNFKEEMRPEEVAEILNLSENFVHLPEWNETFCKAVGEAALCGCNIISNNNVGAIVDKVDIGNPQTYINSQENLIKMIKQI